MIKRRSNNARISRNFIICLSVLFLLLMQCSYYKSYRNTPFGKGQIHPKPNQFSPNSITCDVSNGASFSADNLRSINWTITGFIYNQYLIKEDGIIRDFGTIPSNQSYVIHQIITPTNGWHAFSIHIRNQTATLSEVYVAVEIIVNVPIWSQPEFWIICFGSVASVSVATSVVFWRRMKKSETGQRDQRRLPVDWKRGARHFPSNILPSLSIDVIPTHKRGEERWFTFISTTRVKRIWLLDINTQQFTNIKRIQRDLWEEKRESTLDQALRDYLINNTSILQSIGVPNFAVIVGMRDRERLLWIRIHDSSILAILLNGRVTRTFLILIIRVCKEFESIRKTTKEISPETFFDTLEAHLKISRSFSHIELAEETYRILKNGNISGLFEDLMIREDARGLTPSECAWVLGKVKELQDNVSSDSALDEVEHL